MTIYDDVTENADAAHVLVSDQFTVTQNWATTTMNQTLAFLSAMGSIGNYTVPEVILKHVLPSSINVDDFAGIAPGELTLNYTAPEKPVVLVDSLDGIFLFAGADYSSVISSELLDNILNTLQNGGTGLDATVEAAIFARALARLEAKNVSLYDEAENYFAGRGWNIPVGMLSGRLLEIQKEISRETAQLNYEVTIKQAELADQNTKHNKEAAIQLELGLRSYYVQEALKELEVSKARSVAAIQEFTTKIDAAKLGLELYSIDYTAIIALIDAQVKAYLGEVQAYETKANAYKAMTEAKATIYSAEASISRIEADIALSEIDAEIKAFLGVAQLNASVAEGGARIAAQIAAGAMSAVNAGVSFNYGASESASTGYSNNISYSESIITEEILQAYE